MATIQGPLFQVPGSLSDIFEYDEKGNIQGIKPNWANYWAAVQETLSASTRNGPTASRPTSKMKGRYTGMPYFDTSLGFTIYLKTASSDVWVDGAGTPV